METFLIEVARGCASDVAQKVLVGGIVKAWRWAWSRARGVMMSKPGEAPTHPGPFYANAGPYDGPARPGDLPSTIGIQAAPAAPPEAQGEVPS